MWHWTEFICHCFYVAPKSIKDLVVVTVIRATGDTSAGTLISRSIIEHLRVRMFKQGLDCFPFLGLFCWAMEEGDLGHGLMGTPLTVKTLYTVNNLFAFYIFTPGVIWTSVAADLLPAPCWGSGVQPRPLFHCSLLFIVTCECVWVCLLVLVGDLHWNLCIQSGCLATWLEFSPLMVDPICVWLAPWSDRMVVDFQCCWSVAEIQERHVQLWTYDLRETQFSDRIFMIDLHTIRRYTH